MKEGTNVTRKKKLDMPTIRKLWNIHDDKKNEERGERQKKRERKNKLVMQPVIHIRNCLTNPEILQATKEKAKKDLN